MNPGRDRHLSPSSFDRYLRTGVPIDHPIPGPPPVTLFIDPGNDRIGLRGPDSGRTPAPRLENLVARRIVRNGEWHTEIAITDPSLFSDAYPLLCAIADRVQIDGEDMADALAETLRRLGHLLRDNGALSREAEAGLLGELCLLEAMSSVVPLPDMLSSWTGPREEEHDFALVDLDVEVKTTTSERRKHWISSLTQLVPSPLRPLWIVSLQVTDAGQSGLRLQDVIERIRRRCGMGPQLARFDELLLQAGWNDRFGSESARRWMLRTRPLAYAVTGDFPRLSPDLLTGAGLDGTRLVKIMYEIDLTGMVPASTPVPLADALPHINLESA